MLPNFTFYHALVPSSSTLLTTYPLLTNALISNLSRMEVVDIFGEDALSDETIANDEQQPPDGLYIREVVYIEVIEIEMI